MAAKGQRFAKHFQFNTAVALRKAGGGIFSPNAINTLAAKVFALNAISSSAREHILNVSERMVGYSCDRLI
jgi:hypothetical protein